MDPLACLAGLALGGISYQHESACPSQCSGYRIGSRSLLLTAQAQRCLEQRVVAVHQFKFDQEALHDYDQIVRHSPDLAAETWDE